MLVAKSQSMCADLNISYSDFLASDYDCIQAESIKYVCYFVPIIEHIATKRTFLHRFAMFGATGKTGDSQSLSVKMPSCSL